MSVWLNNSCSALGKETKSNEKFVLKVLSSARHPAAASRGVCFKAHGSDYFWTTPAAAAATT
jgi:hypothetical protein